MNINNSHLSSRAYRFLALLAASIGLSSSAVTARFFILGLERMEPDSLAREALVGAGVLMILTELLAFGLAALLPRQQLKALRWRLIMCGVLLLSFETATIYVTQVSLSKASQSIADSVETRISDMRISIESQRAVVAELRENAVRQSNSKYGVNRAAGATAFDRVLDAEKQIAVMALELAQLEATKKPTMTDVLGETGMLMYNVVRSLLISIMGLVMFGAAGSLLRASRDVAAAKVATATSNVAHSSVPTVATVATAPGYQWLGVANKNTAFSFSTFAFATPIAAISVVPMVRFVPAASPVAVPAAVPVPVDVADRVAVDVANSSRVAQHAATPTHFTTKTNVSRNDARYEQAKAGVLEGSLKPSVRSVQRAVGGSTSSAQDYLRQMSNEKLLEPFGRGWVRAATSI